MKRTEEFTMHSGRRSDNVYANSTDFSASMTKRQNRPKTKEPPPAKRPQGWVIITFVVLLILVFLIMVIFTILLCIFYNSITEQQAHLRNNDNNFTKELSHLKNSDSLLQKDLSDLKKSVANITDNLKMMRKKEASCTSCPAGWRLIGSKCYYFQESGETWEKSKQNCARLDGVILILKDRAELNSLIPTIGSNRYWLGLRRDITDVNLWLWADGSSPTFSAWNVGEPNNDKGKEHCAEIIGALKLMNDRDCNDKIGHICKSVWTC